MKNLTPREIVTELDRQEGMRLLYVALTRAKHQVNVLYSPVTKAEPGKRRSEGKFDVLRYLVHGGAVGEGSSLEAYLGAIPRAEELARFRVLSAASSGAKVRIADTGLNLASDLRDQLAPCIFKV